MSWNRAMCAPAARSGDGAPTLTVLATRTANMAARLRAVEEGCDAQRAKRGGDRAACAVPRSARHASCATHRRTGAHQKNTCLLAYDTCTALCLC